MTDLRVVLSPVDTEIRVRPGATLAEAIRAAGEIFGRACGESGICGRCRVTVDPASAVEPPDALELRTASMQGLSAGERLACLARLRADATLSSPLWRR